MTAFAMGMLSTLSAEILLGQMSYRQKADIYNYVHGYDAAAKFMFDESSNDCLDHR